eukprot:EG_transcript_188
MDVAPRISTSPHSNPPAVPPASSSPSGSGISSPESIIQHHTWTQMEDRSSSGVQASPRETIDSVPAAYEDPCRTAKGKVAPCRYFAHGRCNKGEDCPFPHLDVTHRAATSNQDRWSREKKKTICWYFAQGRCNKGKECPFPHVGDDSIPDSSPLPSGTLAAAQLPHGSSINQVVENGVEGARNRHLQMVQRLLKEKAELSESDQEDMTPEERLAHQDKIKVAEDDLADARKQRQIFENAVQEILACSDAGRRQQAVRREIRRFSPPGGCPLPVYAHKEEIIRMVKDNPVVVIVGHTGSGKSTQIIQYLHDSGLADGGPPLCSELVDGHWPALVCAQPRGMAAASLATRVAEEWAGAPGVARRAVGAMTRGKTAPLDGARMLFATNYRLLEALKEDPLLRRYAVVIVDEVHERSMEMDLILGLLKSTLAKRSHNFRLVVTSATLNHELLCNYFGGCPLLNIRGRTFPVEVRYQPSELSPLADQLEDSQHVGHAWRKALDVHQKAKPSEGHILVFLTGQDEIEAARRSFESVTRTDNTVEALPLHGKLTDDETQRVYAKSAAGQRKVIFATNVAETSVTIEDVGFVIDCGLAKVPSYDAVRGIEVLSLGMINRSSAEQRKGRAGRTRSGVCIRLYSPEDMDEMPAAATPQILATPVELCILQLKAHGVEDVMAFDFLEPPPPAALMKATKNLRCLGCVEGPGDALTKEGRITAQLSMDPRLCRMIFKGNQLGVGYECVTIAAIISSGGSLFHLGATQELKAEANQRHVRFYNAEGDFITLLKVYNAWNKLEGDKRAWCMENRVNGKVAGQVQKRQEELIYVLGGLGMCPESTKEGPERRELIRRAVAEGFFLNIAIAIGLPRAGFWLPDSGKICHLHPSSALFKLNQCDGSSMVVFHELSQTTRLFMKQVTPINKEWLKQICPMQAATMDLKPFESCKIDVKSSEACKRLLKDGKSFISEIESEGQCWIDVQVDEAVVRLSAATAIVQDVGQRLQRLVASCVEGLAEETSDTQIVGCTRALIGKGGLVKLVLLQKEFVKLYVANAPSWEGSLALFRQCGDVAEQRCLKRSPAGDCGFVRLRSTAAAEAAQQRLNGYESHGMKLSVQPRYSDSAGVTMYDMNDNVLFLHWGLTPLTGTGIIYFREEAKAQKAANLLDGRQLDGVQIRCEYIMPQGEQYEQRLLYDRSCEKSLAMVWKRLKEDIMKATGVKVLNLPKETPGVIFLQGDLRALKRATEVLASGMLQGKIIDYGCSTPLPKRRPGKQDPWVRLSGLSSLSDEGSVQQLCCACGVEGAGNLVLHRHREESRPPPTTAQLEARLRAACKQALAGLGEVEIQFPSYKNYKVIAKVTVSSPSCIDKLKDVFECTSAGSLGLGHGRLRTEEDMRFLMALPMGLLKKFESGYQEIKKHSENVKFREWKSDRFVEIKGGHHFEFFEARKALVSLFTGEVFPAGAEDLPRLMSPQGLQAMRAIEAPGTFLHVDRQKYQVVLFGDSAGQLKQQLRDYLQQCSQRSLQHKLLPGQVKGLLGRDGKGLERLASDTGCAVRLDLFRQLVVCEGTPDAVEAAQRALLRLAPATPTAPVPGPATLRVCAFCSDAVETGEPSARLQACGHETHLICAGHAMENYADRAGSALPVVCGKDDCREPLWLCDLRRFSTNETFQNLCVRAFCNFVTDNHAEYFQCPSAGCLQVVRGTRGGSWRCDNCHRKYCVRCTLDLRSKSLVTHEGMDCMHYRSHPSSSAATYQR